MLGGLWGRPRHVVHPLKERENFGERGKEDKGGRKIGIKRRRRERKAGP